MKQDIINFDYMEDAIENVKIFFGKYDGIQRYDRFKYVVTRKLVELQQAQKWFPTELNYNKDKITVARMMKGLADVYQDNLAFQTIADSLANRFLDNSLSEIITSPEWEAVIKWQANFELLHCFAEGTEILTDKGFIDFKDLTYEDRVANYHEANYITFETPTDIIKMPYKGKMIAFQNESYHQNVTPNHRMVTRKFDNTLDIKYAEDIDTNRFFIGIKELNDSMSLLNNIDLIPGISIRKTEYEYDGFVYCATVSTGMLIIRSNGIISVSGNSESYSHNIREVYGDPESFFREALAKKEIQDRLQLEIEIYNDLRALDKLDIEKDKNKMMLMVFKAIIAQYVLENIRFMISFLYTFKINDMTNNGIPGTANSIALIANDENIHTIIFKHLINILKKVETEDFTHLFKGKYKELTDEIVYTAFDKVIESELKWYEYLSSHTDIDGMIYEQVKDFLHHYSNYALKQIGYEEKYSRLKEPTELISFFEKRRTISGKKILAMENDNTNYTIGALKDNDKDNELNYNSIVTNKLNDILGKVDI